MPTANTRSPAQIGQRERLPMCRVYPAGGEGACGAGMGRSRSAVKMRNKITWILLAAALLGGTACGDDAPTGDWEAYADKCAMPRTGVSPTSGRPYADVQGTLDDEKRWLKEWTQDLYLWYAEVPS